MASRSYTYSPSKTSAGVSPDSKGGKSSATPAAAAMPVYQISTQSSKKRKVVDLAQEDEEDEEAASRAQDALAGKRSFISERV